MLGKYNLRETKKKRWNWINFSICVSLDLPMTDMTTTVWTSSNGSPCSKTSMRNSTTMTWTAKRGWSARSWGNPNTMATWPKSSNLDSSKFTTFCKNCFSIWIFVLICINWPCFNLLRYAKYLEVLSLPDDMRELLDEYLDANSRAEQQKACEEFFQCPYSIKDSVKRNLNGNSL